MAKPRWKNAARISIVVAVGLWAAPLWAQQPQLHMQHDASTPPGAIGRWQLRRGGPLRGYFQPVEIRSPSGARIAPAVDGAFAKPQPGLAAGMLIGAVYRFKVTGIPLQEGRELFPTLEVIDRTYPPTFRAQQFPIVVELAQNDLELALKGHYVTRVIYLEHPRGALPVPADPQRQEWFDVRPGEDPLRVADALGRPVAILRIGARVPANPARPSLKFLYGCPPLRPLEMPARPAAPPAAPPEAPAELRPPRQVQGPAFPRPGAVLRRAASPSTNSVR